MLRHVFVALMFMLILAPLPAKADMVLDWNEYALQTIGNFHHPPGVIQGFGHYPRGHISMPSTPSTHNDTPINIILSYQDITPATPPPQPRSRPPVTLL